MPESFTKPVSRVQVQFARRNAPRRGPSSSRQYNANNNELATDLSSLSTEWNDRLVPLMSQVPNGSDDTNINAYANGLDGKTFYVDSRSTGSLNSAYYNSGSSRPNTVYEQFSNVYTNISELREFIDSTIGNFAVGASQVSIEDRSSLYTATDVEEALAEVMVKVNALDVGLGAGYLPLAGGTMIGSINLNSNELTSVDGISMTTTGLVDGRDVSADGAALDAHIADTTMHAENLTDIDDVTITTPASGEVLFYNGSQWENTDPGIISTLSGLSDTTVTAPASGEHLVFNGTEWVNTAYQSGAITEALTIPVDYNDGTAIDPPAGVLFSSQDQIDAILAASGTSNFKHLNLALAAVAPLGVEKVTVNLASGIHLVESGRSDYRAFLVPVNIFTPGTTGIEFIGDSTFELFDPSLEDIVLSGYQAGSGDPYYEVASGTLSGFDVRGYFAEDDLAGRYVIHDHDDTKIYVTGGISGTPSTVSVVKPSTVLMNSDDGATKFGNSFITYNTHTSRIDFKYMTLDLLNGNSNAIASTGEGFAWYQDVVIDASTWDGNAMIPTGGNGLVLWNSSLLCGGPTNTSIYFGPSHLGVALYMSYVTGAPMEVGGGLGLGSAVIDGCNKGTTAAIQIGGLGNSSVFNAYTSFAGVDNTIKNTTGSAPALRLNQGARFRDEESPPNFKFVNNAGPCISVAIGANVRVVDGTVITTSGNTDVGLLFEHINAGFTTYSGTDFTGSAGDIQMGDGTILTWSGIQGSAYADTKLNIVEHR